MQGSMLRKITFSLILIFGLGVLAPNSWGSFLQTGNPAPPFVVESGDNQKLTRDMVLGKVVVLFYESRQAIDINDELKEALKCLYRAQPAKIQQEIFRLVVIDCSEAVLPTIPLWKSKLSENSRLQGFTIYGDWNRKMLADYGMQGNNSNFLIIDKHGIVRYSGVGRIASSQIPKIEDLLHALVQQN
jgi:predicted transcriptional regulator